MFDSLLGTSMSTPVKFVIAFLVVLALIGLTAWLVRRFGADRLGGGSTRGRQPRLAVIDAATVDGRRRLVLIRRDNIEHLLMIGGPTDVVVEQNIVRATAARDMTREAPRAEPAARTPALENGGWPLQPSVEPAPTPAASIRPTRSAVADEPWLPQAEAPAPRTRTQAPANSLTGLAAELSTRLNAPEPAAPVARSAPSVEPVRPEPAVRAEPPRLEPARAEAPRSEPTLRAEPRVEPEIASAGEPDGNLAEMAQKLEAALRMPPQGEGRPPVTDPLAVTPADAAEFSAPGRQKFGDNPRAAERKQARAEERQARVEARMEERQTRIEERQSRGDDKSAPKNVYDNLEQEMASLLGRPTNRQ